MKGLMMKQFNPGRRALLSAALATPFLSLTAQAQGSDWPNRPVRVVVPGRRAEAPIPRRA
jgi:hypothetical protein